MANCLLLLCTLQQGAAEGRYVWLQGLQVWCLQLQPTHVPAAVLFTCPWRLGAANKLPDVRTGRTSMMMCLDYCCYQWDRF